MKKRIMAVLLAVCIMVSSAPYLAADVQAEEIQTDTYVGLDAEYHTQDEIREYYKNHPIKDMEAEFVTEPSVTEPYALGELTDETKHDALCSIFIGILLEYRKFPLLTRHRSMHRLQRWCVQSIKGCHIFQQAIRREWMMTCIVRLFMALTIQT